MSEIWKKIPKTKGYYSVSNLGNVRRDKASKGTKTGLMKLLNARGYKRVCLSVDQKLKWMFVHRLVLEAFVGKCPKGMATAHLNGRPSDNRLDNLRWVTPKENSHHILLHGNRNFGQRNGNCKKKKSTVILIKKLLLDGVKDVEIAKRTGVKRAEVARIRRGERWAWLEIS